MAKHETVTKAVTAYSMVVDYVSINHQMWAIQDDAQYGTGWTPERQREFEKLERASDKLRDKTYEACEAAGLDWSREVEDVSGKLYSVEQAAARHAARQGGDQ